MKRTTKLFGLNQYLRLAVLCQICVLASCENFLVSICDFDNDAGVQTKCHAPTVDFATTPQIDAGSVPSIGLERRFVLNATIALANRRFVGMNGIEPITLAAANFFETFDVNFDTSKAVLGPTCTKCPAPITGFDFPADRIYKADERFFFFHYKTEKLLYELNGNTRTAVPNVLLNDSISMRPFTHPNLDFMMIESKSNNGNYKYSTLTLSGDKLVFSNLQNLSPSTMSVIGDLDSNDPIQNGFEFITFRGGKPTDLFHYNTDAVSSSSDMNLLNSLAATISSTKSGDESDISTAYIANLNNDAFPDFIYVRNGKVLVTSYLGIINGAPQFKNWSSPVLEITGQKINSILAIQMTGDSSPELIVETETELQFYVNNPKS